MVLLLTNISLLNAQSFTPSQTADNISGKCKKKTKNTGNDIRYFESSFFQISVWDGDRARLGYDYGTGNGPEASLMLDGNQYGQVEDPDVVLQEMYNTLFAFIIYTIEGKVYYEVHSFYQGTHSLPIPSQQIGTSNLCSNPNVDIDDQNNLVAVWADTTNGKDIIIAYSDIFFTNSNTTVTTACHNAWNPDVAIYNNGIMSTPNIRITANSDYDSENAVIIIKNDAWTSGIFTGVDRCEAYKPDYFGRPRIAASANGNEMYEVVVDKHEYNSTINTIMGCTFNGIGVLSAATVLNPNLQQSINTEPVVSFVLNTIVVAWTNESTLTDKKDIIQQKLSASTGLPYAPNTYEVVNQTIDDHQFIASVSGRYSSSPLAHFTFMDILEYEINYKLGNISNNYVRLKQPIFDESKILPNPATDVVKFQLKDGIGNAIITIFDLQGKMLEQFEYNNNTKYDVSKLINGVYFVEIKTENTVETIKLIIN